MVSRGILLDEAVEEFEKKFIKAAMEGAGGNQCRAAKLLGIHRNTLSRKLEKFHLDRQTNRRR
jgi:DNA-binding NtrC family response regulator